MSQRMMKWWVRGCCLLTYLQTFQRLLLKAFHTELQRTACHFKRHAYVTYPSRASNSPTHARNKHRCFVEAGWRIPEEFIKLADLDNGRRFGDNWEAAIRRRTLTVWNWTLSSLLASSRAKKDLLWLMLLISFHLQGQFKHDGGEREREGGEGQRGRHHVMVVTIIRMMCWETRTEVHHIRSSRHTLVDRHRICSLHS